MSSHGGSVRNMGTRGYDMNNYDPKNYWEERGKNYSVSVDTSLELRNLGALKLLKGSHGDKVLEVGPGYGRICEYMKNNGLVPAGYYDMCDISTSMADECHKRTGIMPLLYENAILPYEDNQFDWLISFSVMLHVPLADIKNHLSEYVRVCKKHFYVATYTGPPDGLAKHCFTHNYIELFLMFGLEIVSEKTFMTGLRTNWLLKKGELKCES